MRKLFFVWALSLAAFLFSGPVEVLPQTADQSDIQNEPSNRTSILSAASVPSVWSFTKSKSSFRHSAKSNQRRVSAALELNLDYLKSNPESIKFPLPSGVTVVAARTETDNYSSYSWVGRVQLVGDKGDDFQISTRDGEVILSMRGNYLSGVIYMADGTYEIYPAGDEHYIVEFDSDAVESKCNVAFDEAQSPDYSGAETRIVNGSVLFGTDAKSSVIDSLTNRKEDNERNFSSSQAIDSGDRVDVMVVYSGSVLSSFGGTSQLEAFLQTAMTSSNTALRNSNSRVRLNLVRTVNQAYSETGNLGTDLNWLKGNSAINQQRNEIAADLVVMMVESGNACGTSQLLTNAGVVAGSGLAVVKRSCAVGGTAFAHEIGHLFGADHDPLDSPIPASAHVLPFAYGNTVNGQFVTLMGFFSNALCPDYCPRLLMFSNPAVSYNGMPTGIAGARDNTRVVEYTADAVANIRVSQRTITLQSPNTTVMWRRNMIRDVTWNSSNFTGDVRIELSRDAGRTFQVLVESTPNTGVKSVQVTGPTTRYARIRVVSIEYPQVTDTSLVNFSIL